MKLKIMFAYNTRNIRPKILTYKISIFAPYQASGPEESKPDHQYMYIRLT